MTADDMRRWVELTKPSKRIPPPCDVTLERFLRWAEIEAAADAVAEVRT
jgi:hypothetical protein